MANADAKYSTCSCSRFGIESCTQLGSMFCSLPVDIFIFILSSLPASHLARLSSTNRTWQKSSMLWKPQCLSRWPHLQPFHDVKDWRALYVVWSAGKASQIPYCLKCCPMALRTPSDFELACLKKEVKLWGLQNTCPFGGVPEFQQNSLQNWQVIASVVMQDVLARCKEEMQALFQCDMIYEHEVFIGMSQIDLDKFLNSGWESTSVRVPRTWSTFAQMHTKTKCPPMGGLMVSLLV